MEEKKKHSYIFPNILADVMSKVDMRTQLEASMMSMSLMLCGLILTGIYMIFYLHLIWWYKIVLGINILAGVVFMSSFLITTFQQYRSYMEIVEYRKEMKGGETKDANKNSKGT